MKKLFFIIFGLLFFILSFFITLKLTEIPFSAFLEQYILFPLSLGESRMDFLLPLEFKRIVLRFKLIHLSSLILLIVIIKNATKNLKYIINDEFLIIVSLIGSSFALIVHQLMTINGMFIFFIIPILCGFSHVYYLKYLKDKDYILYFLMILSISSTLHYSYKYIHTRDFMDLGKINKSNAIDAKVLDKKLSGLQWITILYPNDPSKEINQLIEAIEIIKNDKSNKILVTDYQFISVVLEIYDYSPNKYWYKYHVYPTTNHKYFQIYKNFFVNKLIKNKIQVVYIIKPLWGDDNVLETILDNNCLKKTSLTNILDSYFLENCKSLEN